MKKRKDKLINLETNFPIGREICFNNSLKQPETKTPKLIFLVRAIKSRFVAPPKEQVTDKITSVVVDIIMFSLFVGILLALIYCLKQF